MCFEAYTYLSSLTYDQAQISAFVSFMNVMGIVYNGGFCIGNVLRTNVGNLLGSQKFEQAKNLYWFYIFIMSCVGVIGGGLMYWFRMAIAGVYTGLEDVSGLLGQLIGIYSLALIPEFILGMNNTVMRITGNVAKMIVYLLTTFVGLSVLLAVCLCFWMGMGVVGLGVAFGLTTWVLNVLYLVDIKNMDWKKVSIDL